MSIVEIDRKGRQRIATVLYHASGAEGIRGPSGSGRPTAASRRKKIEIELLLSLSYRTLELALPLLPTLARTHTSQRVLAVNVHSDLDG